MSKEIRIDNDKPEEFDFNNTAIQIYEESHPVLNAVECTEQMTWPKSEESNIENLKSVNPQFSQTYEIEDGVPPKFEMTNVNFEMEYKVEENGEQPELNHENLIQSFQDTEKLKTIVHSSYEADNQQSVVTQLEGENIKNELPIPLSKTEQASENKNPNQKFSEGQKNIPVYYMKISILKQYKICACLAANTVYVYNFDGNGYFCPFHENDFGLFLSKAFNGTKWEVYLSEQRQKTLFHLLKSDHSLQIDENAFNTNEYCINVKNGVVDIRTGKLKRHNPDYLFNYALKYEYDEDYAKSQKMPKGFNKMLEKNFPDENDRVRFLESLAYVLSDSHKNKVAFFWYGEAHTGKSTYGRLLEKLLGKELVSNVALEELSKRFCVANLYGKKLNLSGESAKNKKISSLDIFKGLVGNDYLNAEFKGKNHFSFLSKTKLVFIGNSIPKIDEEIAEEAVFDRLEFVEFKGSYGKDERISFAEEKLMKEEGSQILSVLMRYLKRLCDNGEKFTESDSSKKLKNRFINLSEPEDIIGNFFNDRCIIQANASITSAVLYSAYVKYCKENAYAHDTETKFFRELPCRVSVTKCKLQSAKKTQLRGWRGITLKDFL